MQEPHALYAAFFVPGARLAGAGERNWLAWLSKEILAQAKLACQAKLDFKASTKHISLPGKVRLSKARVELLLQRTRRIRTEMERRRLLAMASPASAAADLYSVQLYS
ncbi:hypothetical protein SEVIR_9G376650v4 [Setaria viridis]|uniref:Uncharacterized protein n=1 Tax=Setaria viridis TaxID=4556 RepID=A0A4U6TEL2_SETVI|nr:hypothetical protein SEVIR_9G376650v2 [Setaria viridis]